MTIEERLNRIEHVTAGIAEERRRDREEYRQLRRDQQRRIDEMNRAITRFAEESRAAYVRCQEELEEWREESRKAAEESRAADKRLGERIDSLGSAMGKFLAELPKPRNPE